MSIREVDETLDWDANMETMCMTMIQEVKTAGGNILLSFLIGFSLDKCLSDSNWLVRSFSPELFEMHISDYVR